MTHRSHDWIVQARHDLEHARLAANAAHNDWACFAAQQSAEKSVKSVLAARGAEAWGHRVSDLLDALASQGESVHSDLRDRALEIDKHYIPTRYPNGLDSGAPADAYTRQEAAHAISTAEEILRFCEGLLA